MRVLPTVPPSKEQLPIVLNDRPGVAVLRGAAGSGKTTTALLRLRQLCRARLQRRDRSGSSDPVRVLVLAYNRSLAGYISALAEEQIPSSNGLDLTVTTFASWAQELLDHIPVLSDHPRESLIAKFGAGLNLTSGFMASEVDYAQGRFGSDRIAEYVAQTRDGRGNSPRVDKSRFLSYVLEPYLAYKHKSDLADWNDIAERAVSTPGEPFDIIIVDEAQDFSATQVRAVLAHRADDSSVTFILDSLQRIYPRYYTWKEVGLDANQFVLNVRLSENLRNTRQIAAFARPFVEGLPLDENGQLPDLNSALKDGDMPVVFSGSFSQQATRIVDHLHGIDLDNESVGIFHPLGGGWFSTLEQYLDAANIQHLDFSRRKNWPTGPINVGLSTLHSAKGLEFDHVVVCGVTGQTAVAPHDEDDTATQNLRRLLAMAFGRAKETLLLCHDATKPAAVLRYLDPATYVEEHP